MESLLRHLLTAKTPLEPVGGLDEWATRHAHAARNFDAPVARAAAGAFVMDRLGYAFASGYREALRALIPELGDARFGFCATEEASVAPKAMRSTLTPRPGGASEGWTLNGENRGRLVGEER